MAEKYTGEILILGLGNDILRDDGVGHHIANDLREYLKHRDEIEIRISYVSGYYLLDEMAGYRWVIIIDGMVTGEHSPGEIVHFTPDNLTVDVRYRMSHNVHLPTVLRVGEGLGYVMPERIDIFGIEVLEYMDFGEMDQMSDEVRKAMPIVLERVLDLIDGKD